MKKYLITCLFISTVINSYGQPGMRPVSELIEEQQSGWIFVKGNIAKAGNKTEILPVDSAKAKDALFKTQVTTRSPMGAIIYHTGGLLIDDGWIRILGSGSARMNRSLPDWNLGKSFKEPGERPSYLLIADDAIGGFFILNGGLFKEGIGKVFYLSPDNLNYEPLDVTYTGFLDFCLNGDLDKFYSSLRWKSWRADVAAISGDQAFNCYPFLFTKEGKDIEKVSRKVVPVTEQYFFEMDMQKQLQVDDKH